MHFPGLASKSIWFSNILNNFSLFFTHMHSLDTGLFNKYNANLQRNKLYFVGLESLWKCRGKTIIDTLSFFFKLKIAKTARNQKEDMCCVQKLLLQNICIRGFEILIWRIFRSRSTSVWPINWNWQHQNEGINWYHPLLYDQGDHKYSLYNQTEYWKLFASTWLHHQAQCLSPTAIEWS